MPKIALTAMGSHVSWVPDRGVAAVRRAVTFYGLTGGRVDLPRLKILPVHSTDVSRLPGLETVAWPRQSEVKKAHAVGPDDHLTVA
jgi:hypothetical protein